MPAGRERAFELEQKLPKTVRRQDASGRGSQAAFSSKRHHGVLNFQPHSPFQADALHRMHRVLETQDLQKREY